ncbi:YitT family protein [Pseudoroseicyclus tamaricis]|uniref:YitT family protein n=1 Tax=Pseudoroseicyclus tamaricis TaxID=2705421 RepID=A0A6B2JZB3_9RHOB|nr:YitT family protein [Pseudoroseicyclus tamaricis]NDV00712.1 YitT family protein [Pseudoroseicyclus tamaricis]
MPAAVPFLPADAPRHTPLEDAQGLAMGVLLAASGLVILTHLGLITGQTAGIAVIISYLTGWSFGVVFFLVNLPFYWIAWRRMGLEFTLKSIGCVAALSVLADLIPGWFHLGDVSPAFGAVLFGAMTGLGLLAIFRHKGSLGGLGVIAVLIQDTTGFRAGHVQLIVDAVIFLVAFFLFPAERVLWSLLGALVLNAVIAFNHRRDWYVVR